MKQLILPLVMITGTALGVIQFTILQKTLIHWAIPTSIWIVTGIISSLFTHKLWKKYPHNMGFKLNLFLNTIGFGGIAIFTFLALNSNIFFEKENRVVEAQIIDYGEQPSRKRGCKNPVAYVVVDGYYTQLIFPCDAIITPSSYTEITLAKGLFGFEVVVSQSLKK